ncbi:MAG: hypothetical protein OSA89_12270 [Mariniblastus sp.]|nr:hypothetical protein [Mariniblastus sp.]
MQTYAPRSTSIIDRFKQHYLGFWALPLCLVALVGCGTTTTRTATEQLLMSDAVDQAISQIDFQSLRGQKVFLDTLYLHSVKGVGFVNSEYIISSLRQQLTASSCLIQDTRESADIIVEPRVGALGTDGHEVVYGIPQAGTLTSAASMFSNSPLPALPELSFGKSNAQSGIAKVIVFAYDRESRTPIWQSGIAKAESTSSNTWYLGAGPFQKGTIYEGMRFAGQKLPPAPHLDVMTGENLLVNREKNKPLAPIAKTIEYGNEYVFEKLSPNTLNDSSKDTPPPIQNANYEDEIKKTK